MNETERKTAFVKEFGELLAKYNAGGIRSMEYTTDEAKNEIVRVKYDGGGSKFARVEMDSLLAIIEDLYKQHCMY